MVSPDHKPCAATCCNGQPRKIGTLFCERHQQRYQRQTYTSPDPESLEAMLRASGYFSPIDCSEHYE